MARLAILVAVALGACSGPPAALPATPAPGAPSGSSAPVASTSAAASASAAPYVPAPLLARLDASAALAPSSVPPFIPWSDAPEAKDIPTGPLRVQDERGEPVAANHVVLRVLAHETRLFVYSDACGPPYCGVSLTLPRSSLRRGAGWAPTVVVPFDASTDTAYALQITRYDSAPHGGGFKPEYGIGKVSGRLVAFSRAGGRRVWAGGSFTDAPFESREVNESYPLQLDAPPWAQ